MERVYLICMILGIVFPLLNLLFDVFDDAISAVFSSFDFLDLSGDGVDLWFLPLSWNSICGFLLFFGGAGRLLGNMPLGSLAVLVLAVLSGYLAAVGIQFMIRKLRKVEHPSVDVTDLLLYEGKVEHEIAQDGFGSVSFRIDGRVLTYPAKSADGERIAQETVVYVKEILDQNVLLVEDAQSLEKKYQA